MNFIKLNTNVKQIKYKKIYLERNVNHKVRLQIVIKTQGGKFNIFNKIMFFFCYTKVIYYYFIRNLEHGNNYCEKEFSTVHYCILSFEVYSFMSTNNCSIMFKSAMHFV